MSVFWPRSHMFFLFLGQSDPSGEPGKHLRGVVEQALPVGSGAAAQAELYQPQGGDVATSGSR